MDNSIAILLGFIGVLVVVYLFGSRYLDQQENAHIDQLLLESFENDVISYNEFRELALNLKGVEGGDLHFTIFEEDMVALAQFPELVDEANMPPILVTKDCEDTYSIGDVKITSSHPSSTEVVEQEFVSNIGGM